MLSLFSCQTSYDNGNNIHSNQHESFNYYLKKSFAHMDMPGNLGVVEPETILAELLDNYLQLNKLNKLYYQRVIGQQWLATAMKEALNNPLLVTRLNEVFRLLNDTDHSIAYEDDIIWLFSAYCSLFPAFYSKITNPHIKEALVIRRDIHDANFLPIMSRFMQMIIKGKDRVRMDKKMIDVAHFTHQYEPLLKKIVYQATKEKKCFTWFDALFKPATAEQVENMILPLIMSYFDLGKNTDETSTVLKGVNPVLDKISIQTLHTKVVPALLKMYQQHYVPIHLGEALLKCVERMDADALKQNVMPVLRSFCLDEENHENFLLNFYGAEAYRLLFFIMSKLSKEENDKLVEEIINKIDKYENYYSNEILTFLKNLRQQHYYVNDSLFQKMSDLVVKNNDAFIQHVKPTNNYDKLYVSHMTAQQVVDFFAQISLRKEYKKHGVSFLEKLAEFASLPSNIYTKPLIMESFQFALSYFNDDVRNPAVLKVLTSHLKIYDFSVKESRKILLSVACCVIDNVQNLNDTNVSYKEYINLLETCISLMTEQEIKNYVLPRINLNKFAGREYCSAMQGALCGIFSKINDQDVLTKFFIKLMVADFKGVSCDYGDVLRVIIEKFDPITRVYLGHQIAKCYDPKKYPDKMAYLSAIFYNSMREAYGNIPEVSAEPCKASSFEAKRS